MKKDGGEYELNIPYEDLDETVYGMLSEIESTADRRNCFIEGDLTALDGSGRSW